jgi:hypothetical protein
LVVLLAGAALPASAQNALGDGRALDNNLSTRGRTNQARPNIVSEFAFRNSVVTGNAPGGLSFRGEVGYLAPGEFAGELGSNDLFAFRRDSLQSGMAGMGIRGTEALQYQLALTTGNQPPSNLMGRWSVSRSMTAPSAGDLPRLNDPGAMEGLHQRPATDPDSDDRGTMLWMLRSPSAYISNASLQTSALRRVQTADAMYTLTASPLRGVRLSPIPAMTADAPTRPPAPSTETSPAGESAPADPGPGPAPVRTMHSEIMSRLFEQQESLQNEDVFAQGPSIADRVREMIMQLGGQDARREIEGGEEEGVYSGEEGATSSTIRFDPKTMRLLRGDGRPITEYVNPADAGADAYAEHLRSGQELMARARYFDAEERFAHALSIRRGDITAQVARLHAQLGAGMFLSASLNMQSLALMRPEVFAVRYGPELLPSPQRIEDLIAIFRETIDDSTERSLNASPQVRQTAGLLLAYLGFQSGRAEVVREGIADFRAQTTRGVAAGTPMPLEARIAELFGAMWTIDGPGAGE